VVWAVCLFPVIATLLPVVPTDDWWIRIFDFPRPQIAAVLALAMPAAWLLLGLRRAATRSLAVAMLASLGLQLAWLWPYTTMHPVQAPATGACGAEHRLSLVVANLREGNSGAAPLLDAVRQADPDLVFVVEVDRQWVDALRPLEERYAHRVLHPRDDFWGFALYARLDLVDPEVRHLLSDYVPSLRTGLRLGSGAVAWLHGLHPKPPLPGEGTGQRDAELLLAAQAVRDAARPAVVAGDLNAVAWSDTTALVQRIGALLDPRVGRGAFVTFPTWLPAPLRVPIDHVFFTLDFRLLGIERLPDIGSDHLPLLARLCHVASGDEPRGRPPAATGADRRRAQEAIEDGREDAPLRRPAD
jgi:endonuclease/exonuclease/phosphatase (EEP) superfamily protein YafD